MAGGDFVEPRQVGRHNQGMGGDGINPYEPPQLAGERQNTGKGISYARGLVRVLMMGLIGYGSFVGVGLLYLMVAEFFQLEIFPSLQWALGVGIIGAAVFAGSELLNSGTGNTTGLSRRILVAAGVFVASLYASSTLSEMLGWRPRTYEDEGEWAKELVLYFVVYFAGLVVARVVWIGTLRQEKGHG